MLDEKGMTLQAVILSGLLALVAVGFGLLLWNIFTRQSDEQPGSVSYFASPQ